MANKALILSIIFTLVLNLNPIFGMGSEISESHPELLIYEVSPYSYSGTHLDYVCIENFGSASLNLNNYFLTDFEGYLALNGTIKPHQKMYIAENSTSFYKFFGFHPDWTYSEIRVNGTFSLSNSGDTVAIVNSKGLVDLVAYGNINYTGPGWQGNPVNVHQGYVIRRCCPVDTNTSEDWLTYHKIGQSDFSPISDFARIEVFALPDSRGEILRFIRDTKSTLEIEMYTMTSSNIGSVITSLLDRGVSVRILLEGSPVGGIPELEKVLVQSIYEHGGRIFFMVNGNGRYNRYTFVHTKFIVRDGESVMILTENMDLSSLSPCGNRGYGVIIHSRKIAKYIEGVFQDDIKTVQDIVEYRGEYSNLSANIAGDIEYRRNMFSPLNISANLTLVLSPDYAYSLLRNFVDENRRIDVEALYLKGYPLSLIYPKASRILVEHPLKGYDMKKFNADAKYLKHLHAKLLIGDRSVFVGSMNFGNNSLWKNRELSVIIEDPHAVKFFRKVFDYDWKDYVRPFLISRVNVAGSRIIVNMSVSTGKELKYFVYLDGNLVYKGSERVITIPANPGRHTLELVAEDMYGVRDREIKIIYIPQQSEFNLDIAPYILIFTVFLYYVWKNHGSLVD